MLKRPIFFVGAGLLVAAGIWMSRGMLSHKALASILQSPAPTEPAMEAYVATTGDSAAAIHQLWDSGKIPQREFALNYLIRHARTDKALWEATKPLVSTAATLADSEFQSIALQLLFDHKEDRRIELASGYLASADPDVRITGLMKLNDQRDRKWAATYARLLDDSDSKVRAIAAAGLRNLSGEDFGVHLATETQASAAGIEQWKTWWQANASKYPAETTLEMPASLSPGAAMQFTLTDMAGHKVSLSDFRGKVVLLNFWATWCPSCVAELQSLGDLQRSHPNDLVILGINLDGVSDSDDNDPPPDAKSIAAMRPGIEKAIADSKIEYPTLLDPFGSTLGAYGATALPASVLIGKDGTLKRRLQGMREKVGWDAMVAEAGK